MRFSFQGFQQGGRSNRKKVGFVFPHLPGFFKIPITSSFLFLGSVFAEPFAKTGLIPAARRLIFPFRRATRNAGWWASPVVDSCEPTSRRPSWSICRYRSNCSRLISAFSSFLGWTSRSRNYFLLLLSIWLIPLWRVSFRPQIHYLSKTDVNDGSGDKPAESGKPAAHAHHESGSKQKPVQKKIGNKKASLFAWLTLQRIPEVGICRDSS